MRYVRISINSDLSFYYSGKERRHFPRIETPFLATVRSIDAQARRFEECTVLDNLSTRGLYLRLVRPLRRGIKLFVLIRLSAPSGSNLSTSYIAIHGKVLRTDPRPGNAFGTAITLVHHRFIYTSSI